MPLEGYMPIIPVRSGWAQMDGLHCPIFLTLAYMAQWLKYKIVGFLSFR